MASLYIMLVFLFSLQATAATSFSTGDLSMGDDHSLQPRQIITSNPLVSCCASCTASYDSATYLNIFDDFCGWAGNYLELWTTQTYFTGDTYCKPDNSSCIQLLVQYLCGEPDGNEGLVTYTGCMGYLEYAINPNAGCGPPYRGARIASSDGCWNYQATASLPVSSSNHVEVLQCDETGRWCHLPMSNATLPIPDWQWDEPVHII